MISSGSAEQQMPDRLLLCTDLDRTLIPNGEQPESAGAREHFTVLARHPHVTLAYVSGRHRELVQRAIQDYQLPQPQFVIGDVGTTIYAVHPLGEWRALKSWEDHINSDWQHVSHAELQQLLAGFPEMRLQEPHKQNRHKLSFYVARTADQAQLLASIADVLAAQKVRARQVWSVDESAGVALLDIVPISASKYHAIQALQSRECFSDHDTVFSGDSGNDIDVLVSSIPATLVANSAKQVQREAIAAAAAAGNSERLYIAQGGFRGMNGNYSAGIIEGVAHYHPETIHWMGFDKTE